MSNIQNLPWELIFQIIASLVEDTRTILPPSHEATKTLWAFTVVCRATYSVAANLLRQNCVYIDKEWRLRCLLQCLWETEFTTLRPITSLFLSPPDLDTHGTVSPICELVRRIQPSLTRLVVDTSLNELHPGTDNRPMRAHLFTALGLLTNLEEFVNLGEDLELGIPGQLQQPRTGHEVWCRWPKLRRLALYGVYSNGALWRDARHSKNLETVILTRARGLCSFDIKAGYLGVNTTASPPRSLKVVLVDVEPESPYYPLSGQRKWTETDPSNLVQIFEHNVPTTAYGHRHETDLCRQAVKEAALQGDIWGWEGSLMQQYSETDGVDSS